MVLPCFGLSAVLVGSKLKMGSVPSCDLTRRYTPGFSLLPTSKLKTGVYRLMTSKDGTLPVSV